MAVFILRRAAQGAATLLVLLLLAFGMARATGDPRDLLLPPTASAQDYANLGRELGLDRPLYEQFGVYLRNAVTGDLGRSVRTRGPVASLLLERLGASAQLSAVALSIALIVGLSLGVLSAQRRNTSVDRIVKLFMLIGQSVPSFWVGIMLIQVFAVLLRWLPSGSNRGPQYIILPAITLALFGIAALSRLMRSSMLDTLDSEFVKFARVKGTPEATVIWKYGARNAVLPVVTFAGILFAHMITQQIVIETVFAWPGVGQLTYTAVLNRDFPVVQGVVLVAGVIAISVNLFTDILYTRLDPRIRHGR